MKRIVFLLLVTAPILLHSEVFWVYFKDKSDSEVIHLSQRREIRDAKSGIVSDDWYDREVGKAYIRTIREFSLKIRHRSRWLNAVSVEGDKGEIVKLKNLPFVRDIHPVMIIKRRPIRQRSFFKPYYDDYYGYSHTQLSMVNIPALHAKGLNGRGVLIVLLDTGFRKTHQAFQGVISEGRLLAERDFVWSDGETADEIPADTTFEGVQQSHGTAVWSIVGGYAPGELIGAAYGADFALAKTERLGSETTVEMDNWVAAVEWADSLGADVVTSSLAYREFDDFIYTYADMNGYTTPVARIAAIAAEKGICVINSMGNEGPSPGSLWSPADSRGVLSVGAVTVQGEIAYFSSRGPTSDGRIKPDVCALGVQVYHADYLDDFGYTSGNGTSFSAPVIAGGVALIRQKHPEWTPDFIYAKVRESGNRAQTPDNDYGWGIPDFLKVIRSSFEGNVNLVAYPNPAGKWVRFIAEFSEPPPVRYGKLQIFSITGRKVTELNVPLYSGQFAEWDFENSGERISSGVYFYRLEVGSKIAGGKMTILK